MQSFALPGEEGLANRNKKCYEVDFKIFLEFSFFFLVLKVFVSCKSQRNI